MDLLMYLFKIFVQIIADYLPLILTIFFIYVFLFEVMPFLLKKLVELNSKIKANRKYGIKNYTCKFFSSSDKAKFEYVFRYFLDDKVFCMNHLFSNVECSLQDYIEYLLIELSRDDLIVLKNEKEVDDDLVFDKNSLIEIIKEDKNVTFDLPLQNSGITDRLPNNLPYLYVVNFQGGGDIIFYGDKEMPSIQNIRKLLLEKEIYTSVVSYQVFPKKTYMENKLNLERGNEND